MKRAFFFLALLAAPFVGCLHEFEVEETTYPCRQDVDCVEGYECDRVRWVCVLTGTSSVAPDAGTSTVVGG